MNKLWAMLIIAVVVLSLSIIYYKYTYKTEENNIVILTTFPGIDKDVELLLQGCSNVEVKALAPPGSDPHTYNLRPEDIKIIKNSLIIISTGHAPFENAILNYAKEKTIIISKIDGMRLDKLPTGAVNLHMPIYDPYNYKIFINYTSIVLEEKLSDCRQQIESNRLQIIKFINKIEQENKGLMRNTTSIASSPVVQYAVSWLGTNITAYLVTEHETQVTPEQARIAEEILERGGIAIIVVDGEGNPLGESSSFLLELATDKNAKIMRVEAPFTPKPILYKIQQVVFEAHRIMSNQ